MRAKAIRSYNEESREWPIWWLDGRTPHHLDTPVVGRFSDKIGYFYANDIYEGQAIKVRFIWNSTNSNNPKWEQAFSTDNGETSETNWTMEFTRK